MTMDAPAGLVRQPLFAALTRPQMLWGVTYPYFVANLILATEACLVARSFVAIALFALVHAAGYMACLSEPRRFDLYLVRLARARRVRNAALWGGNSYRP